MPKVTLLVLTIARPTVVAIYLEDSTLAKSWSFDEKLTDKLYSVVAEIEKSFEIERVAYANGPGSFMGLKLAYVFLQTYATIKNIAFVAASSFVFADKIHSNGKRWFVKRGEDIDLITLDGSKEIFFMPPKRLDLAQFRSHVEPNYILPAV